MVYIYIHECEFCCSVISFEIWIHDWKKKACKVEPWQALLQTVFYGIN